MSKKKRFLSLLLSVCMVVSLCSTVTLAANEQTEEALSEGDESKVFTTVEGLESEHDYKSYTDETWVYTSEVDNGYLKITFDEKTSFENGWDYLYIYDGNDELINTYTGTELSNATIYVPGNTVKFNLQSDGSSEYYGFKVTSIESVDYVFTMDSSSISIDDGEEYYLYVTAYPESLTEAGIEWTSSDNDIATVDDTGMVTGVSKGKAVITATLKNNSDISANCNVEVMNNRYNVSTIDEFQSEHNYKKHTNDYWYYESENDCAALKLTFDSRTDLDNSENDFICIRNYEDSYYDYYYDNELSGKEVIIPGNRVEIRLWSDDYAESWGFAVTDIEEMDAYVKISRSELSLDDMEEYQLNATVYTNDGESEDSEVTWSSSNLEVASVDGTGLVTGVSKGTATITAEVASGAKVSCQVEVVNNIYVVTSMEELESEHPYQSNADNYWIYQTEEECAGIKLKFSERTCMDDNYDDYIRIYDLNGTTIDTYYYDELAGKEVIIPGNGFKIRLKSYSSNGEWGFKVINLEVLDAIVSLNASEVSLYDEDTYQFEVTAVSATEENPTLTWTSSDPEVATVDSNGLVTAMSKGEAIITVTMNDGSGLSATSKVVVENTIYHVTNIEEFQSEHDYAPDSNSIWIYEAQKECAGISIKLDDRTCLDSYENDYIEIENGDGGNIGYYYYKDLAGKEILVPGDTVRIRLRSYEDSSCGWGFAVTEIKELSSVLWLDDSYINMEDEDTYKLYANIESLEETSAEISWTSSNPEVATVDSNGLVTAVSKGNAEICAELQDGSGVKAICYVEVYNNKYYVDSVDELESLHNYRPDSNEWWYYESPNENVILKILFDEKTDIGYDDYIEIYDGNENWYDSYYGNGLAGKEIIVPDNEVAIHLRSYGEQKWGFKVTSIEEVEMTVRLSENSISMQDESTYDLDASAVAPDGTEPKLLWTSSNPEVATVDENGTVTSHSRGFSTITATMEGYSDLYDSCEVEVYNNIYHVSSAKDIKSEHNYAPDIYDTWIYEVENDCAALVISFDDNSYLDVDYNDYIRISDEEYDYEYDYYKGELAGRTVIIPGNYVRITFRSYDDDSQGWGFEVTDIKPVNSYIRLYDDEVYLDAGASYDLEGRIYSTADELPEVKYTSSNPEIATVDDTGHIMAVSKGEALITAELQDGSGAKAVCNVYVESTLHKVTDLEDFQSNHDYEADTRECWVYEADKDWVGMTLTFDERTLLANDYDMIRIYDGNDNFLGEYYDDELAGAKIDVQSNKVKIWLYANDENQAWGFKVTAVEEIERYLSISNTNIWLDDMEEYQLQAEYCSSVTGEKTPVINWTSSNPEIAAVDSTGKVTAVSKGLATITAYVNGNEELSASCQVEVYNNIHYVTDYEELESKHNYEARSNEVWIYEGSDNCVAMKIRFDERTVLDMNEGSDYIYISGEDDEDGQYFYYDELAGKEILVRDNKVKIKLNSYGEESGWGFKVTSVEELKQFVHLRESELNLSIMSETYQLQAETTPDTIDNLKWTSSNPEVASVNEEGILTIKKEGVTTITVGIPAEDTSVETYIVSDTCEVTVRNNVVRTTNVEDLESEHEYSNNMDDWWIYTGSEGCEKLRIKFDEQTALESHYDTLYVFDGDGRYLGEYSGNELSGKTIVVPGNVVKLHMTTDGSVEYWGFKVKSIKEGDAQVPTTPLAFASASLTLHDNIAINFKARTSLFSDVGYENAYIVFEHNGEETVVRDSYVSGVNTVFDFTNIAPHQMDDTITATLYAEFDGVEYKSEPLEYSVSKYAYNMLGRYNTDDWALLRTLLVDLLNYGSQSQIYTGYNTNALVNGKLTETQKAWGTSDARTYNNMLDTTYVTVNNPTATWKAAGLNLKDRVEIRLKFVADDIDNLMVKARTDSGEEWIIDASEFEPIEGGGYYVYFNKFNAGQMRELVYFTLYEGDEAVSNTLRYSIESYASSTISKSEKDASYVPLADLLKKMMMYGDSAKNYINQ